MKWAPNPYAIAHQLSGKTDESLPSYIVDGERADAFLRGELVRGKVKSIDEAIEFFQRLSDLVDRPQPLSEILGQPLVKTAIEWYGQSAIRRVLPYLVPIGNASFGTVALEGDAPDPSGTLVNAAYSHVDKLIVDDVSYLDPMQGDVGNCYLIATMIALAWSRQDLLVTRLNYSGHSPPKQRSFEWQFYNRHGAKSRRIKVSATIPLTHTGLPRYARSISRSECWPGLIEKAYVIKARRAYANQSEPKPADYRFISNRSTPQAACQALIGGRQRARFRYSNAGVKISSQLVKHCISESGLPTQPVMAWTQDSVGRRSRRIWTATGIWPNHAYAVLGKMQSNHVVLRNPHGYPTQVRPGYATGTWITGDGITVRLNKAGVFAISLDLFDQYFDWIGWVH